MWILVFFTIFGLSSGHLATGRSGHEILYDISAQAKCTEVTRRPSRDCRWSSGLNLQMDQIVEGGRIVAFKLQWFSGAWSGWYVPGYNDMDKKFNPYWYTSSLRCSVPYIANSLRRMWSYFYDHNHMFVICKP